MGYVIANLMSMSKMNKRYYCVEIILYTENQEHMILLSDLINTYDYAYILHNKDTNDDGSFKKEHIHLLLFFKNARWGSSILNEINIDNSNLIEFRENKANAIQYLIHSNNHNKYQYDFTDIKTNQDLSLYFNKFIDKESSDISIILEFIDNNHSIIYFKDLYYFVLSNNLWSTYRRNYSIIKDIIFEHNSYLTTILK